MLVLSRKVDEAIEVDGPAKFVILEFFGRGKVKIGVIADKSINVTRPDAKRLDGNENNG